MTSLMLRIMHERERLEGCLMVALNARGTVVPKDAIVDRGRQVNGIQRRLEASSNFLSRGPPRSPLDPSKPES